MNKTMTGQNSIRYTSKMGRLPRKKKHRTGVDSRLCRDIEDLIERESKFQTGARHDEENVMKDIEWLERELRKKRDVLMRMKDYNREMIARYRKDRVQKQRELAKWTLEKIYRLK